jgi:ABC-type sugar transport system ATPase subunit
MAEDRPGSAALETSTLEPRALEPPALEVEGLSKRFEGVVALDDVSFALAAGRVHGLIGQNGAGKSTLINILSGMVAADAGSVRLAGAPVAITGTRHALALGIATVYQELSLLPNLTVAQNLSLGREPRSRGLLDTARMGEQARAALDRLGVDIAPAAMVGRLSLAARQMVEIAKSLATNPRILILDEPTASLGSHESELLFAALARLKTQGVAILYVSHRFAEVLALCDGVTVLRNGRLVVTTSLAGWTEGRLTDTMIGAKAERFERTARERGEVALELTEARWRGRVRGVSLVAHRGEILALSGLLGAGQNETARLIGGDIAADAGHLTLCGETIRPGGPRDAVKRGVCLLTEDRKSEGILPNRTLRENIAVASLPQRSGPVGLVRLKVERTAAATAAHDFGVTARSLEAPVRTLSGGNQQKAMLARWDLATMQAFVLIEPTRGVDVGARAEIYRRLDRLARAGKAIIVVSSDLAEVLAIADRILVFRDGRIHAETTPQDVDEDGLNLIVQGVDAA